MSKLYAIGRTTKVVVLLLLIIVAAFGVGYLATANHTTSLSSLTVTLSYTGSVGTTSLTLTNSPTSENCSSNSNLGTNLNWTSVNNNPNSSTIRLLVLAINSSSSSTASLCVQYTKNPSPDALGVSNVNVSAEILTQTLPSGWDCCAPNITITAQPSQLHFGNNSDEKFFVKYSFNVSPNSGSYDVLSVSGLCQFAALIVNQDTQHIIISAYSNVYEASCGYVYGAVGELIGISGFSYGYINESIA